MATTPKRLVSGSILTTSAATYYTAGTGVTAQIEQATATLLPSGLVLVAGGYDHVGSAMLATAELYDAGEHKNVAKQVSQMEDLIANKVDVIAFVPGTGVTALAQIDQAIAAGIPVVNVNIMSEESALAGFAKARKALGYDLVTTASDLRLILAGAQDLMKAWRAP